MKFFITFGSNSTLNNNYLAIDAVDESAARDKVFETYGAKWGFIYDEKEFAGQPEKYGLTEVPFGTQNQASGGYNDDN